MHKNIHLISLIAVIVTLVIAGPVIPLEAKRFVYSVSLTLKEILIFFLPILIFSLLFKTSVTLAEKATKMIFIIIAMVCFSNFTATFLSHYVGSWVYHFDLSVVKPSQTTDMTSMWDFKLFKIIANDKAMFFGLASGILFAKFHIEKAKIIANKLDYFVNKILKSFIHIIPFFIAGFIAKLEHDGIFSLIIKDYLTIFIITALSQVIYIFTYYLLVNKFNANNALINIRNMLPAAFVGLSSMSSAASLPVAIIGAEKNAHDKDLSKAVVPATINIHLIADCIMVPIIAYAILKTFDLPEPTLYEYLIFTGYFVVTKFSVAAVPGGGIFVMLPILEKTLNFTPEMLSMITAIYLLFDPILAFINVLGNGGFAKMIDNINYYLLNK